MYLVCECDSLLELNDVTLPLGTERVIAATNEIVAPTHQHKIVDSAVLPKVNSEIIANCITGGFPLKSATDSHSPCQTTSLLPLSRLEVHYKAQHNSWFRQHFTNTIWAEKNLIALHLQLILLRFCSVWWRIMGEFQRFVAITVNQVWAFPRE